MDQITGANPVNNNPRMDLLHGGHGAVSGGAYGAGALTGAAPAAQPAQTPPAAPPVAAPAPLPQQPAVAAKATPTPKPTPPPAPPAPRSAPEPKLSSPAGPPPNSKKGLIIGIILLLLALAGAGIWAFLFGPLKPAEEPQIVEVELNVPTDLTQTAEGKSIDAGKGTNKSKVTFELKLPTSANAGEVTPEIEVQKVGTPFSGTPSLVGNPVKAGGGTMEFQVSSEDLSEGGYHWQARLSKEGEASQWVSFTEDDTATAFVIDMVAPSAPIVTDVGGNKDFKATQISSLRPKITGTTEPNAVVTLTLGATTSKTVTADEKGNWTYTPSEDIAAGKVAVSITTTDTAGNVSQPQAFSLTVGAATATPTPATPAAPAAPAAPVATAQPTPAASAPAPAAASQPPAATELAATGDTTLEVSLLGLTLLALTGGAYVWIRRRESFF